MLRAVPPAGGTERLRAARSGCGSPAPPPPSPASRLPCGAQVPPWRCPPPAAPRWDLLPRSLERVLRSGSAMPARPQRPLPGGVRLPAAPGRSGSGADGPRPRCPMAACLRLRAPGCLSAAAAHILGIAERGERPPALRMPPPRALLPARPGAAPRRGARPPEVRGARAGPGPEPPRARPGLAARFKYLFSLDAKHCPQPKETKPWAADERCPRAQAARAVLLAPQNVFRWLPGPWPQLLGTVLPVSPR